MSNLGIICAETLSAVDRTPRGTSTERTPNVDHETAARAQLMKHGFESQPVVRRRDDFLACVKVSLWLGMEAEQREYAVVDQFLAAT